MTRPGFERATVLVTVKTYPNPSAKYEETVCVAGVRLDRGAPEWIRLYPVRFRNIDDGAQFDKFELIEVDIQKHGGSDPRIESYRPDQQSINHVRVIGTGARSEWRERTELIGDLRGGTTTCDLIAAATSVRMNEPAPSLGLIKPTVLGVEVSDGGEWSPSQLAKIDAASQPTLFGEGLRPLEPMPFRVTYRYRCESEGCSIHTMTVLDWELGQAGRRWRREYGPDAANKIRQKWEATMLAGDRDTHFFIGNQHQHRGSFSVLGVWWPPRVADQFGLFGPLDVNDRGLRADL